MAELPSVEAMFKWFAFAAGGVEEARYRFQRLIQDLISAGRPGVNEVSEPNGSDWGIDTYAGSFDDSLLIWQSKCFLEWVGPAQQKQVRDSFAEVLKKATEEGFKIGHWTLCVPCILPPGQQKWFDNWAAKMRRAHGIAIEMWNGSEIRRQLQLPDNVSIRELYFANNPQAIAPAELPEIAVLVDPAIFEEALFVKQLEAAGHLETDAAKGLYFAAEALVRDLEAQGSPPRIAAMREIELGAHEAWETHFNAASGKADEHGRMSGLVDTVTASVAQLSTPPELPLRSAHKKGVAHRLVEAARAGWILDWRGVVRTHQQLPAPESAGEVLLEDADGE